MVGYHHKLVAISVVGTSLTLPIDAEPYGSGESELTVAGRLLARMIGSLGPRFADFVVVDGKYWGAGFSACRKPARLTGGGAPESLPQLRAAVEQRFHAQPSTHVARDGQDRWTSGMPPTSIPGILCTGKRYAWSAIANTNRMAWCRGGMVDGFPQRLGTYHMAKSRWEIETEFNDAKNRYGWICHHEKNSVLLNYLITLLALTIEKFYRIRYLLRGKHPPRWAAQLCRLLWASLSRPRAINSS